MKRRSSAGGKPATRRKAVVVKRRNAPKAVRGRDSSDATQKTEVTRLSRELQATSQVLKVIGRSTFDLPKVLNTLVESAARLCEADKAQILRPTGKDGSYYSAASYRHTPEFNEHLKAQTFAPGRNGVVGRVLLEGKSVQIPDVLADPEYTFHETARLGSYRTILGVPLLRERTLIGLLVLHRTTVRPFTDKQIELVETFAAQAVIAIENVRLFDEVQALTGQVQESLEYQTAISDVLNVISRSPDELQPVLDTIVQTAARLCEAEYAVFFRFHEGKCHIAASNAEDDFIKVARENPFIPTRASCSGRAMLERRTVHVLDASTDPEYAMPDYQLVANNRTMLGVPLLRDGVPLGTITLWKTRVDAFTQKQIELVTTFADQALIAIENVRLFEAEQQRTRELTESLEQQTATSDVLRVISSSPADIQPVLDTIGERAEKLCDAEISVVSIVDGELIHLASIHGMTEAGVEAVRRAFPMRRTDETVTARAIRTRSVCHVADVLNDPQYQQKDTAWISGYRGCLGVPMVRDEQVVGAIFVARRQPGLFSDTQIQLLKTFADHAVIAIENVRLFKAEQQRRQELAESLEQQTATSTVLRAISSSPGNLQSIFRSILANATRICGAQFGTIFRYDGKGLVVVAWDGVPPKYLELLKSGSVPVDEGTVTGRAAKTKQVIHVTDISAEMPRDKGQALRTQLVALGGVRTLLAVPMLKEGQLLGAISIYRTEVRAFTDKQIALVTSFANQAVIAVENARLLNELHQRTADLTESLERQTATSEVLQVISSSPGDLQPVFEVILESATRICEAKFSILMLAEGDAFRLGAVHDAPQAFAEFMQRGPVRPNPHITFGRAVATKRVAQTADITTEQPYLQGDPLAVAAAELGGYRTVLAVPILKEGEIIGALVFFRQEVRTFNDKQIALVQNFASQAVIAIENARLLNELRESLQQQTATADVLKVISRSTFDLQTVLQTLVESAARLCEADKATITRQKGEVFYRTEAYGFSSEFITSEAFRSRRSEARRPDAPCSKVKWFIFPTC
jgi:GAF domain-containing protein